MRYLLNMKRLFVMVAFIFLLQGAIAFGQEDSPGIELQSALKSARNQPGDPMIVTAWVTKGNEVLNSREITRHLKMSAYIKQPDGSGFLKALFDNGMDGDIRAGDGVYSYRFTAEQSGDYSVKVIAEGKGFKKVQEHPFKALKSGHAEETAAQEQKGFKVETKAEAETKTETGKQIPQKFFWITFGIVNFIAAAFWIAGFMFLYLRVKRQRPLKVESKEMAIGKFVREQADEKMKKQLATDEKKEQGPVMISETPAEVLKENEDLKKMVRELEASLKTKEKELADTFKHFEALEAEYMILYQEKQAAQQQPDI